MKKSLIVLLLIVFALLKVNAQEPQKIVELFFKVYQEKGYKPAIQYAIASNPWIQADTSIVAEWENNLQMISRNQGDYCGYELLETTKKGDSFIEYTCLIKYEKAPFEISIVLYKPKDAWQVNNITMPRKNQMNRRNQNNNRRNQTNNRKNQINNKKTN